jgi:homoprotocatechuate degradation regulator HpaR
MTHSLRHRNLPQLLLQSREALMQRFRPTLNAQGVTEQQWRILRQLLCEDGLEPRQLCERCLISSPSITGVLARMEEAGLIHRERMGHDQRRVRVTLTAQAQALGERMTALVEQHYAELETLVGVQALQQVYDVLDTLLQRLDPAAPGSHAPPEMDMSPDSARQGTAGG